MREGGQEGVREGGPQSYNVIVNVCALVLERLFHVHHLLSLVARLEVKSNLVERTVGFKRQLHVWYVMLRVSSGRAAIQAASGRLPL